MSNGPRIAFIDDHQEELQAFAEQVKEAGASESKVYNPSEVSEELLRDTDLVIVDYTLEDWVDSVQVDNDQLSLKPINGIALSSVLREHSSKLKEFPPTGFALITGKPERLCPTPSERRPHVVSRLNNVEWYFEKQTPNPAQVISLATAISQLPESVSKQLGSMDALLDYFEVTSHRLRERFYSAVSRCRPPIHDLAQRSHGLVILRWLLHRILPHTTFLMDSLHLAARLRITPDSLRQCLTPDSPLSALLSEHAYTGPLDTFDGPRWWREGVEQLLWENTEGESSNTTAIHKSLEIAGVQGFDPVTFERPVVVLDQDLKPQDQLAGIHEVVQLQLDDWPSYAEPAYMRKDYLGDHPDMKMFAVDEN